jgi:hypothetical protein
MFPILCLEMSALYIPGRNQLMVVPHSVYPSAFSPKLLLCPLPIFIGGQAVRMVHVTHRPSRTLVLLENTYP